MNETSAYLGQFTPKVKKIPILILHSRWKGMAKTAYVTGEDFLITREG
jgi:hypothetical protein